MDAMDRQLRYFLCIAECGSLSRAAEVLDQTQAGLSKQLAILESNWANRCSCELAAASR